MLMQTSNTIRPAAEATTIGLVFHYDAGNAASWKGAPTTNLLPGADRNGRFTTANDWGTYNTNSYNNNTYFSIGTIASVVNNVVTTVAPHPIRSYDALNPQTSGGGLTAGTNYFVKKLNDTQFTLHAYNGSQSGADGYIVNGYHKVHESIALDQRVAVTASGFPTMWHGAPHLPNSGLVKEIVAGAGPEGQNVMRFHVHRTDGVVDGMAYGVYTSVTAGDVVNVSYWVRSNKQGATLGYSTYFGASASAFSGNTGTARRWNRVKFQWVASVNFAFYQYFWPQGTNSPYWIDIADLQVEINTGVVGSSSFVVGARTSNQVLTDLTGNLSISAPSLTYVQDGFRFNGVDNYLEASSLNLDSTNAFTLEAVVKFYTVTGSQMLIKKNTSNDGWPIFQLYLSGQNLGGYYSSANYGECLEGVNTTNNPIVAGRWYHLVFSKSAAGYTSMKLYINGQPVSYSNYLYGSHVNNLANSTRPVHIGKQLDGTTWLSPVNGEIPITRIYNRQLSDAEVLRNFQVTSNRFI